MEPCGSVLFLSSVVAGMGIPKRIRRNQPCLKGTIQCLVWKLQTVQLTPDLTFFKQSSKAVLEF